MAIVLLLQLLGHFVGVAVAAWYVLPFIFLLALVLWSWFDMIHEIYAKRHPNAPPLATRLSRALMRLRASSAWRWLRQLDLV